MGIPGEGWDTEWSEEREVFWPLVAFTTGVQIIEGHGNLSDRWTMLLFCSPLWTGPSIMGVEINSIHQLFVSLGPLMPPFIARGGFINVCGLDLSPLAWHRIKTLLFLHSFFFPPTIFFLFLAPTAFLPILPQFWPRLIVSVRKMFTTGNQWGLYKLEFIMVSHVSRPQAKRRSVSKRPKLLM